MRSFWERVHGHLDAGRRVFVACVAGHTGGSPGAAGARLLLCESGERFGTIGGGAMEHRLLEQAAALLRRGGRRGPTKQTLRHSETAAGAASGLICEGSQTNVCCVLDGPRDLVNVRAIVDAVRGDRRGWVEIDAAGLRLVDDESGGEGRRATLTEADGAWRYREDLFDRRRIAIIGGGHCAAALGAAMAPLDYRVRIFDTREETAAGASVVADYADAGPSIAHPEHTVVVVMTPDYRTDARALLGVAPLPFPFVGLLGGRRKIDRIFGLLREAGVAAEMIERIHAPVGLDIGSRTPAEIAVSIAAQVLRERTRR